MDRKERISREFQSELKTRAEQEGGDMVIEGYFAVFNQETELFPGAYEELAPEAFDDTLSNDVRALINHDTTLVLGRNKSGTLELKADSRGLWGRIKINPNDTEFRDDGKIKWTIRKVDLHEVSVCTFPAYAATGVQARQADLKQHKERQLQQRKQQLKARLRK